MTRVCPRHVRPAGCIVTQARRSHVGLTLNKLNVVECLLSTTVNKLNVVECQAI